MGKVVGPPIPENEIQWVAKQKLFFVASASLSKDTFVNVSPKSSSAFRVLNDNTVGYVDYTGSGAETAAHLLENGRLTIMFVALRGAPKIVRFYGKGRVILRNNFQDPKNRALVNKFPESELEKIGVRAIVVLDVTRCSTSCGFSIPKFEFVSERNTLQEFADKLGHDGMQEYQFKKNTFTIDGLPSIGLELNEEKRVTSAFCKHEGGYHTTYDVNDVRTVDAAGNPIPKGTMWDRVQFVWKYLQVKRVLTPCRREVVWMLLGLIIGQMIASRRRAA